MPRESHRSKIERLRKTLAVLESTYPNAHCELNFTNPLELLIATILSAQCTDKQVNIATGPLFKKYRTAADYATADVREIESDIKRIGLYRNKARNIQACCRQLGECHGGDVPRTMDELTQLEGVGRKTANVVLGNAFGISHGVVVDTHVLRLSGRLGLTQEKTPAKIELALQKLVPQEQWTIFSHWLIWHGRRRCFARNPDCAHCEIARLCPSAGKL
ncbi:MAG: endonuclease III [Verrucomicrobiota bacterium]